MKDYASMSDQHINQLVGCKIGEMRMGKYGACCVTSNGEALAIKGGVWQTFDPCNNPADAWPIIVENGISLAFQDGNWWADNLAYWVDGVEWNIGGIIDKNPLKAAMIAFLMMKESER